MKRIIMLSTLAVLALAACSRSVGYDNNNNANSNVGFLVVEVAADTPSALLIPMNARSVHYARFKFTAPLESGVLITTITLTRQGLGNSTDLPVVWLEAYGERLTPQLGIDPDTDQVEFELDLSLAAGATFYVDVYANMAAQAGSENFFCIDYDVDVGVLDTNNEQVEVKGLPDFPLCGDRMTTTSASVGTLIYGTEIPTNALNDENMSTTDIVLEAQGEDMDLMSIRLRQLGSVGPDEWSFDSLRDPDGIPIPVTVEQDGDYVELTIENEFFLNRGTQVRLRAFSVLHGAAACSTVGFVIETTEDVKAVGMTYGYEVNTQGPVVPPDPATRFIPGPQILFSLAPNNPPDTQVQPGADDVTAMLINVVPQNNMRLRRYQIQLHKQYDPEVIRDVKLWRYDESQQLQVAGGPLDVQIGDCITESNPTVFTCSVEFTDSIDLRMCEDNKFSFTFDVESGTNVESSVFIFMFPVPQVQAEYVNGTPVEPWDLEGGILDSSQFQIP